MSDDFDALSREYWRHRASVDKALTTAARKRLYARVLRRGIDQIRHNQPALTQAEAVRVFLRNPATHVIASTGHQADSIRQILKGTLARVRDTWACGTEDERNQQVTAAIRLIELERQRERPSLDLKSPLERRRLKPPKKNTTSR